MIVNRGHLHLSLWFEHSNILFSFREKREEESRIVSASNEIETSCMENYTLHSGHDLMILVSALSSVRLETASASTDMLARWVAICMFHLWPSFLYHSVSGCLCTHRHWDLKWRSDNIARFFGLNWGMPRQSWGRSLNRGSTVGPLKGRYARTAEVVCPEEQHLLQTPLFQCNV
jgi:hypothetical protein